MPCYCLSTIPIVIPAEAGIRLLVLARPALSYIKIPDMRHGMTTLAVVGLITLLNYLLPSTSFLRRQESGCLFCPDPPFLTTRSRHSPRDDYFSCCRFNNSTQLSLTLHVIPAEAGIRLLVLARPALSYIKIPDMRHGMT
ncbi:hypothetical protein ABFW99_000470 [Gracilimonas sp. BCB1]